MNSNYGLDPYLKLCPSRCPYDAEPHKRMRSLSPLKFWNEPIHFFTPEEALFINWEGFAEMGVVSWEIGIVGMRIVEMAVVEMGIAEMGFVEMGIVEMGIVGVGIVEMGIAEMGIAEMGIVEMGFVEMGIEGTGVVVLEVVVQSGIV